MSGTAPRRIAFLGLGLIGGSIARALRAMDGTRPELVAWTPAGSGPRLAAQDGTVDAAPPRLDAALDGADMVVIAAPPLATLDLLDAVAAGRGRSLADAATVTDVASTKVRIVARADELGLPFVGGHPMAGRESTGYAASDAALFEGRPWVVTPGAHARAEDVARVEWLALGSRARPVRMDAATHDRAVAGISHLPLVVAASLVEAVAGMPDEPGADWEIASRLAATGWRDMTRLARGDVAMGSGILDTNADAVAARVRDLQEVLDAWLADLEAGPDTRSERLGRRLRAARDRLG